MIRVTRLNHTDLWLNPLLIESVERTPDTIVTLTNGHKYVVVQSPDEIQQLVHEYLQAIGLIAAVTRKVDSP